MVQASTYSRQSIVLPITTPNNPSKKSIHSSNKNTPEPDSDIPKENAKKSKVKHVSGKTTVNKASNEYIDLAQDSDNENVKVHNPAKKKASKHDDVVLFFKAPEYLPKDVSLFLI
jgi:hypothetical protein